jgi:hypothetical protein
MQAGDGLLELLTKCNSFYACQPKRSHTSVSCTTRSFTSSNAYNKSERFWCVEVLGVELWTREVVREASTKLRVTCTWRR